MNDNAIVVATPKQPTDLLLQQANMVLQMKRLFKPDVHYGPPYPGSKKNTLLKPGAELLARRFGIYPHYEAVKEILQINPANLSESVIVYIYRCQMIDIATGVIVGEAIGACSSLEDKYRQRTSKKICPSCSEPKIMKSKFADRQTGDIGWYCANCKANYQSGDPQIINQVEGVVVNANPLNELNTIIKQSQKRAMVSAVIVSTGASSYFAPGDAEVNDVYATSDDDSDILEADFAVETDGTFPADEPAGQGKITVEKPATPKNPQPQKTAEAATDSTPKATASPYTLPALYNATLKDDYNNVTQHMKNSIAKLIEEGKLTPEMTLEQAVKVVKNRKATQEVAKVEPAEPVKNAAYYAEQERLDREAAKTALNNEAVTIRKVTYQPSRNGQGKPRWEAKAYDILDAHIYVVLWQEHVDLIKKAGHKFPDTDGDKLDIPVLTELKGSDRRITHVMALDGSWMPFGKRDLTKYDGQHVQITNLVKGENIPGTGADSGFKFTATATCINDGEYGETLDFTLYPTDMAWVKKTHKVGEFGGTVLFDAIVDSVKNEIRIRRQIPEGSQQTLFDTIGKSPALANQLDHEKVKA